METITAIMYHYIRDYQNTKYPGIKGMDVRRFENQVKYVKNNYNVISIEELIAAFEYGDKIPPNSALFTFDDGYADHYTYGFEILDKYNIKGAFYVPTGILQNKEVLDVNKIHYILATAKVKEIMESLYKYIEKNREQYNLLSIEQYREMYEHPNKWDTKEVIFIKRMLQRGLPEELRRIIATNLFERFVGKTEAEFSEELYLNPHQILEMQERGMHFGPHSHNHVWLDSLNRSEQESEFKQSINYLENIGVNLENLTMCYPYGAYDQNTLELVKEYGFKLGWAVGNSIATFNPDEKYFISRIDCNDVGEE